MMKTHTIIAGYSFASILISIFTLTTAQTPMEYDCSFDVDLCNVTVYPGSIWKLQTQPSPARPGSGPAADDTGQTGPGHGFLHLKSADCSSPGTFHEFEIRFNMSDIMCFAFSYHAWGSTFNRLEVYVEYTVLKSGNQFWSAQSLWEIRDSAGDKWFIEELDVPNTNRRHVTAIKIRGYCGDSATSDIGIDSIRFNNDTCQGVTSLPFHCGFEPGQRYCGFSAMSYRESWRRVTGTNPHRGPTRLTGPQNGALEASGMPNTSSDSFLLMYAPDLASTYKYAVIQTPIITCAKTCCLSFQYYMYGHELDLGVFEVKMGSVRFMQRYRLADKWTLGKVSFVGGFRGRISFWAQRGSMASDLMDIAFDDVSITEGICTAPKADTFTSFQDSTCDFEDGFCDLRLTGYDAWRIHSGPSLSRTYDGMRTGPPGGYPGNYLYLRSNDASYSATATLQFPVYMYKGSTDTACLSFDYYLYGQDVIRVGFTRRRYEVWMEVWEQAYNQGDLWRHYQTTIENFNGTLELRGQTKNGLAADIAMDNVSLTLGACVPDDGLVSSFPYVADFEDFGQYFGQLVQAMHDSKAGWLRKQPNATRHDVDSTGPSTDLTTNTDIGYLLYFTPDVLSSSGDVEMILPKFSSAVCLTVPYYMFGPHDSSFLLFNGEDHMWHQSFDQGDMWRTVSLDVSSGAAISLKASGTKTKPLADIAVDDITATEGPCVNATDKRNGLPYTCDFEEDWCDMLQVYGDLTDWRLHRGIGLTRAQGRETGPETDTTTRTTEGRYAYFQSSRLSSAGHASLSTPEFLTANSTVCLRFNYHMYGFTVGMLQLTQQTETSRYLWHFSYEQGDSWFSYERTFEFFTGKIVFKASISISGSDGDIAIDDLSITNGSCTLDLEVHEGLPYICDFETTFCNLKQYITIGDFQDNGDFRWHSGIGRSRLEGHKTGPLFDSTKNTTIFDGIDIYNFGELDLCDLASLNQTNGTTTNNTENQQAENSSCIYLPEARYLYFRQADYTFSTSGVFKLGTPVLLVGNVTVCLSFNYHMYGYDTNRLKVYNERPNGTMNYLWHQRYDHGDTWWPVQLTVEDMQGRIRWEVTGGLSTLSDVAVDDIMLLEGPCGVRTGVNDIPLPWVNDFQDDFGDMVHVLADADEWRWESGRSRSRDAGEITGPFVEDVYNNMTERYALFDASDVTTYDDKVELRTPFFNYNLSVVCLSFRYHMLGYDVNGLWLYLENGWRMTEYIWHTSFEQSDSWYNYSISLYNFSGHVVFQARRGLGVNGDIALDDIVIGDGACLEAVGDYLHEVNFSCTFESSYCDMLQSVNDSQEWRRHQGPPKSLAGGLYTGASGATVDHTYGNSSGFALFLQSWHTDAANPFWFSVISTPRFQAGAPDVCLDFYYHMHGWDMFLLEVLWQRDIAESNVTEYVWHQAYDQGDAWFHVYRTIPNFEGRLNFVGHRGWSTLSYIAIDDVSLYPAPCKDSEILLLPLNCTFEHGYCFMEQNRLNDTGDFHRPPGSSLGRRLSHGTGPPVDHTYECSKTEEGKYVYLHKDRCPTCTGQTAILDTMRVDLTGVPTICLQFWYYFHGLTISSLNWTVVGEGGLSDVWSLSGHQGEDWKLVQINISNTFSDVVVFRLTGVYGSGVDSDIALDDLSFYAGPCEPVPECTMDPPSVAHSSVVIQGRSYGDLANYTCDVGYRFPSGSRSDNVTCDSAEWRCPIADCQIIHCPTLPDKNNLQWSTTDTEWNTTVHVTCDTNYKLPDPLYNNITCMDETKDWDKDVSSIRCNIIECPLLPPTSKMTWLLAGTSTAFTNEVLYRTQIAPTCDVNYKLKNVTHGLFECGFDSEWSTNVSAIECELIHCPEIPNIAYGGWMPSKNTTVTANITLNCDVNYIAVDGAFSTFECLNSSDWNKNISLAGCILTCPALPYLSNGNFSTNMNITGTEVSSSCHTNYALSNISHQTFVCLESGEWSIDVSQVLCSLVHCPDIPDVANGTWLPSKNTSATSQVSLTCDPSYVHVDPVTTSFTCLPSGRWDKNISLSACIITCPSLPILDHGQWVTNTSTTPTNASILFTTVDVLCDNHYELGDRAHSSIRCTETGRWSIATALIVCKRRTCPALPSLANGKWSTNSTSNGTTVQALCDLYYTLVDSTHQSILCLPMYIWDRNVSLVSCEVIHCPELSNFSNGFWSTDRRNVTSVVEAICHENYTLVNPENKTSTCMLSGQWDHRVAGDMCRLKRCPQLPNLSRVTWSTNETRYQTVVTPTCDRYYELSDTSATVRCTTTEAWDNSTAMDQLVQCQLIQCSVLPELSNGNWSTTATTVMTNVSAQCDENYFLTDPAHERFTCVEPGNWAVDVNAVACITARCPNLAGIPGVILSTNDTIMNTVVHVSCDHGYEFINGAVAVTSVSCQADSQWSRHVSSSSTCVKKECPQMPTLPHVVWSSTSTQYGAVVRAQCSRGRVIAGDVMNTFTCLGDRNWNHDPTLVTCIYVQCPPLPVTKSMYFDREETMFGTQAFLVCEEGYRPLYPNVTSVTCTHTGDWSNNITDVTCVQEEKTTTEAPFDLTIYLNQVTWLRERGLPEICHVLHVDKAIPTAFVKGHAVWYITYSCLNGYNFIESRAQEHGVTCDEYGIWRGANIDIFDCEGRECPEVDLPPNTLRDSDDHVFGSMIAYHCEPGYVFPDGTTTRTLTCLADGNWHTQIAPCEAVACPEPEDRVETNKYNYPGAVYGVVCPPGEYTTDGRARASVQCTVQSQWAPVQPKCSEIECPAIPYVFASRSTKTRQDNVTTIRFTCDVGYHFRFGYSHAETSCDSTERTWQYDGILLCLENVCPPVADPAHAVPDTTLAVYGTTVTFTCLPGYRVAGSGEYGVTQVKECLAERQWNTTIQDCEHIDCFLPLSLPNSNVELNSTKLFGVATYICDYQYRFSDGTVVKQSVCGVNKTWSDINDDCRANRCPPPTSWPNAIYTNVSVEVGGEAAADCEEGYVLQKNSETARIICQDNQTWSIPDWVCVAVQCERLQLRNHISADTNEATYRTTVELSADPNYRLTYAGNETLSDNFTCVITCQADRTWNMSIADFDTEFVQCGDVPRIFFAKPDRLRGPFYGGNTVEYTCGTLYRFPDRTKRKTIQCSQYGTWEDIGGCEFIQCDSLHIWNDLQIRPFPHSISLGSRIEISCPVGYWMENGTLPYTSTCVSLGNWYPPPSICWKQSERAVDIPPTESKEAKGIGVPFVLFGATVLLSVLLVDVLSHWHEIRRLIRDVPSMLTILRHKTGRTCSSLAKMCRLRH